MVQISSKITQFRQNLHYFAKFSTILLNIAPFLLLILFLILLHHNNKNLLKIEVAGTWELDDDDADVEDVVVSVGSEGEGGDRGVGRLVGRQEGQSARIGGECGALGTKKWRPESVAWHEARARRQKWRATRKLAPCTTPTYGGPAEGVLSWEKKMRQKEEVGSSEEAMRKAGAAEKEVAVLENYVW